MCNFQSNFGIFQLLTELEGPMKAPWNRHHLLYSDKPTNANFCEVFDRFIVKMVVSMMLLQPIIFFKPEKKLASDRARRLNETCLKPPSAALSNHTKRNWICLVCRPIYGHIVVVVWSKNFKKLIFFFEKKLLIDSEGRMRAPRNRRQKFSAKLP